MLKGSPGKLDDFCKYMATLCFTAIPVYISLLKFVSPGAGLPGDSNILWEMLPPAVFLSSAMTFVYGYVPTGARLSKAKETAQAFQLYYNRVAKERLRAAQAGTVIFTFGVSSGLAEIFKQGGSWAMAAAFSPAVVGGLALLLRELRGPPRNGGEDETVVVFGHEGRSQN